MHEGYPVVIWIRDIKNIATLVHELMHAVFFIFRDRGIVLTRESEEAYTYTTAHLLRKIMAQKKWKSV